MAFFAVKRVPLKPGPPPKRKTALKTKAPFKARQKPVNGSQRPAVPMRQASKAKAAQKRRRAALVKWLIAEGVRCEVCPELARHGVVVPGGCTGLSEIHERRKLSSAGSMEVAANLLPICRMANGFVEDSSDVVKERFAPWLVLRQKDAEWEACGKRADPVPVSLSWCQRCGAAHVTIPPSRFLPCGHQAT